MPIHVSNTEKKAEIARDVVVAYLSHVKDEELSDLTKVDEAISRLIDVVDRPFQLEQHRAPGLGAPAPPPARAGPAGPRGGGRAAGPGPPRTTMGGRAGLL